MVLGTGPGLVSAIRNSLANTVVVTSGEVAEDAYLSSLDAMPDPTEEDMPLPKNQEPFYSKFVKKGRKGSYGKWGGR